MMRKHPTPVIARYVIRYHIRTNQTQAAVLRSINTKYQRIPVKNIAKKQIQTTMSKILQRGLEAKLAALNGKMRP